MGAPQPQAGWYPDPATGLQRYFDGTNWGPTAPAVQPAGVVVTGPNHVLHMILSVLTFWACGGWLWVWLIVAIANNKQVHTVDAAGNLVQKPKPERAKGFLVTPEGEPDWTMRIIVGCIAVGVVIILVIASAGH